MRLTSVLPGGGSGVGGFEGEDGRGISGAQALDQRLNRYNCLRPRTEQGYDPRDASSTQKELRQIRCGAHHVEVDFIFGKSDNVAKAGGVCQSYIRVQLLVQLDRSF